MVDPKDGLYELERDWSLCAPVTFRMFVYGPALCCCHMYIHCKQNVHGQCRIGLGFVTLPQYCNGIVVRLLASRAPNKSQRDLMVGVDTHLFLLLSEGILPGAHSNCHQKELCWVRKGVTMSLGLVSTGINQQTTLQHAQSS